MRSRPAQPGRHISKVKFITFALVKKVVAIFLLTIYLVSTTELSQVLKLPVLVEHYFEHKEKNPGISLIDFLVLHYKGNHLEHHPHDDDYERDQKLPFMVHTNVLNVVFVSPEAITFEAKNRHLPGEHFKFPTRNDQFTDDIFSSSIWQPPKFC